jgi:hypothetical protein
MPMQYYRYTLKDVKELIASVHGVAPCNVFFSETFTDLNLASLPEDDESFFECVVDRKRE